MKEDVVKRGKRQVQANNEDEDPTAGYVCNDINHELVRTMTDTRSTRRAMITEGVVVVVVVPPTPALLQTSFCGSNSTHFTCVFKHTLPSEYRVAILMHVLVGANTTQ